MDRATVEEWYKKYGPMVLRRCRQLLNDDAAAYDAMQEVFVQVLRKQMVLRDDFPSSLLYRTATNIALNMIRGRRRRAEVSDSSSMLELIAGEDDPAEKTATRMLLDRIFGGERASTRVMAVYHFVDGLTLEETARETGMSVSGVRRRLSRLTSRAGKLGLVSDER